MIDISISTLNENKFVTGGLNKLLCWVVKGNTIELEKEINLDLSGFVTGLSHVRYEKESNSGEDIICTTLNG
jgi:hypothetical protein